MDEALLAVEKVTSVLEEIRTATTEQQTGVSQISEAVAHLDSITQQNAAMVEELAAGAQSMHEQVNQVHNTIRVFRLTSKDTTIAEVDAVALRRDGKDALGTSDSVDFDKVLSAHQQWRVTLRNAALKGTKLDADKISRDDCCALGQWIYSNGGQRWSNLPQFTELVKTHKVFHQEAGAVAKAINAGRLAEAQEHLEHGSAFVLAGRNVTMAIRDLRGHVQ
jgi:aerotaxis receptor